MIQYLVICQHDSPRKGALYTPEQTLMDDRRDVVEYMETLRKEDMRPVFVCELVFRGWCEDESILWEADDWENDYWANVQAEKTGPFGDIPDIAGA